VVVVVSKSLFMVLFRTRLRLTF